MESRVESLGCKASGSGKDFGIQVRRSVQAGLGVFMELGFYNWKVMLQDAGEDGGRGGVDKISRLSMKG